MDEPNVFWFHGQMRQRLGFLATIGVNRTEGMFGGVKGEDFKPKKIILTFKCGGGNIMLWGCFAGTDMSHRGRWNNVGWPQSCPTSFKINI